MNAERIALMRELNACFDRLEKLESFVEYVMSQLVGIETADDLTTAERNILRRYDNFMK